MDDLDRRLVARLQDHGRESIAELARHLGLSRTTVQSRLERLERTGLIVGYAARLSDAHQAGQIHAYVLITVHPKQTAAVVAEMRRMPGVRKLQSLSGPFDLIAHVEAPAVDAMDALIDAIGGLEGVERTNSAVVLSTKISR